MAVQYGKSGVVKVSDNNIAEVVSWSLNETAVVNDVTSPGDTAMKYDAAPLVNADGTIECRIDSSDTTGQALLTAGATVALKLYVSDTRYASFNAIISSINTNMSGVNEFMNVTFNFQCTDGLTWT